jgi:hypothetical protein
LHGSTHDGNLAAASFTGYVDDIAVRSTRPGRGGAGHDDHASADLLGAGGIHLDVMHAPVHPIDHQPDPLAHLVAAKLLVEHAADDALGRVLSMHDVTGGMSVPRQPFALQRPVHGLDDVAALPKLRVYRPSQHLERARATIDRLGGDPVVFVRSHVRRLEVLRRAGHAERIHADHWRVPADLPARGQAYDLARDPANNALHHTRGFIALDRGGSIFVHRDTCSEATRWKSLAVGDQRFLIGKNPDGKKRAENVGLYSGL